MQQDVNYLFLKQAASLNSYFGEICFDVPRPDQRAIVFSQIESAQIGNVCFRTGPEYKKQSFKARLISWLKYLAAAIRFSFGVKGQPLLFVVAQPPFLPLVGYLQKKFLGRKYVVWVDDIYPDVLVRRGLVRADGWLVRAWSAFNRRMLSESSHVFTLGPHMLNTLQKYLRPGVPVTIVPTWVDTEAIYPIPKTENAWASEHGLADKFIIMYSGNFGETHDISMLLESANKFNERTNIHFVLIGSGSKWRAAYDETVANNHRNVTVLPWQPFERLSESLSCADVAFVSLSHGTEGISMPSKTYYAMSAGAAILASCAEESDLAEVVQSSNCGMVVQPGVEQIVSAIDYLCSHSAELSMFKSNARRAAVERFSRATNARLLRHVIDQISITDATQ